MPSAWRAAAPPGRLLSALGDHVLTFTGAVDFERFRAELHRALAYSEQRTEFLTNDCLSLMKSSASACATG